MKRTWLVLIGVASVGCNGTSTGTTPPAQIAYQVSCMVERVDCDGWIPKNDGSHVNDVSCPHENLFLHSFNATMCFNSTAANRNADAVLACEKYCEGTLTSGLWPLGPNLHEPTFEHITCESLVKDASAESIIEAVPGQCPPPGGLPSGSSGGNATTRVRCVSSGQRCDATGTTVNGERFCSEMVSDGLLFDECFDPTVTSAEEFCRQNHPETQPEDPERLPLQAPWWRVDSVTPNDCTTSTAGLLRLGINPGPIGSVGLEGSTASLVTTGGYMTTRRNCDSTGEFCTTTLNSLRVQLQDVTLAGMTLRNPQMQLVAPATTPVAQTRLAPVVAIDADVTAIGHVRLITSASTTSPTFTLSTSSTTATLSGTASALVNLNLVAVSQMNATISLSGSTSSPNAACGNQTAEQQLLGFESAANWSSAAPLTLTPNRRTQGCFGMAVGGSGHRTLNSAPFSTPLSNTKATLALDVFIPPAQPNPFYLGAVQMYLSCPAINFHNQYIGQVELTGRPIGVFSTLRFPIPAAIRGVLQANHPACFFSVAVNMNATPTPPVVDNLRYVQ